MRYALLSALMLLSACGESPVTPVIPVVTPTNQNLPGCYCSALGTEMLPGKPLKVDADGTWYPICSDLRPPRPGCH